MPKFHCIHCGQRIDASDELAGTHSSCPTCGGEIHIPVCTITDTSTTVYHHQDSPSTPPPLPASDDRATVRPNQLALIGKSRPKASGIRNSLGEKILIFSGGSTLVASLCFCPILKFTNVLGITWKKTTMLQYFSFLSWPMLALTALCIFLYCFKKYWYSFITYVGLLVFSMIAYDTVQNTIDRLNEARSKLSSNDEFMAYLPTRGGEKFAAMSWAWVICAAGLLFLCMGYVQIIENQYKLKKSAK